MKGKVRNTDYSSPCSPYREVLKERDCLKCGLPFPSMSPYNCICEKCNLENEKISSSVSVSILEEIEILII